MKLKLVPIEDFEERKAEMLEQLRDYPQLDREFGTLITDLNALPFLYTINCCYGRFGNYHSFKPGARGNERYSTGYIHFGLDYTPEAERFFQRINGIKNRHLPDCLFIDDYLMNFGEEPKLLKKNEFCFGVVPLDKERLRVMQMEFAIFRTAEESRKFEPIRDRIWEEWRELVQHS